MIHALAGAAIVVATLSAYTVGSYYMIAVVMPWSLPVGLACVGALIGLMVVGLVVGAFVTMEGWY